MKRRYYWQQLFSLLPREEGSADTGFSQSIKGDPNIWCIPSFSWLRFRGHVVRLMPGRVDRNRVPVGNPLVCVREVQSHGQNGYMEHLLSRTRTRTRTRAHGDIPCL